MLRGRTRDGSVYIYGADVTPEEVLDRIVHDYIAGKPNLGKHSSLYLYSGKQTHRFAIMWQILNAGTGEHHHNTLTLYSYQKLKEGWKEESIITFSISDEQPRDEIGKLLAFIQDFYHYTEKEIATYGIISQSDFDRFQKIGSSEVGDAIRELLENPENYDAVVKEGGLQLVSSVLEWVFRENDSKEIVERLRSLQLDSLQKINVVSGIIQMQNILDLWEENRDNKNEEFWQKTFKDNSWILAQIFTYPVILFEDKAYVGKHAVDNSGSHLADFLYQQNVTGHIDVIEIKTPCADILGNPYRQTYKISDELNGAVNQTLDYRDTIQTRYLALKPETPELEVCNPRSVIVIGNMRNEFMGDKKKYIAFNLFRQNLKDTQIITFDELFNKIAQLKTVLETGENSVNGIH